VTGRAPGLYNRAPAIAQRFESYRLCRGTICGLVDVVVFKFRQKCVGLLFKFVNTRSQRGTDSLYHYMAVSKGGGRITEWCYALSTPFAPISADWKLIQTSNLEQIFPIVRIDRFPRFRAERARFNVTRAY